MICTVRLTVILLWSNAALLIGAACMMTWAVIEFIRFLKRRSRMPVRTNRSEH